MLHCLKHTLNEIRQAIPTEKHLQRLLGDELRTVGEAVQETLKLDQLDTLLNERFEGVAKSLAADLDQLQASLAKDGQDVISDMATQKGQLDLVVEGSDHMSKALSGVQRDIETVGIRVEDAQLAAAEAAETVERVVQTVHHQASAVTDAFRQIKAHFDQVVARQEAEELDKARRTIASLERELSRSRDNVLQLKAADHARAAEVDHLRAALERSENNVSKLGDRVDRLADSLNGVTANASNDRIHIDDLTTQLRQVSDEKAKIAVALNDANGIIAMEEALSDQAKSVEERTRLADELAQCRQERHLAMQRATDAEQSAENLRAATLLSAEQAQAAAKELEACQAARDAVAARAESLQASVKTLLASLKRSGECIQELGAASLLGRTVDSVASHLGEALQEMVHASIHAEVEWREEDQPSPPRKRRRVQQDVDDDDDILSLAFSKIAALTGSMLPLMPTHPSHVAAGVDNVVANMVEHILRHDKTMDGLAAFCQKGPVDKWFCLTEVASFGDECKYIANPKKPNACGIHGNRRGCLLVQVVLVDQRRMMKYFIVE